MRDVAIGENSIVRTDAGRLAVAGGAVDGDVFAEGIAVADVRARHAALPFQVLRFQPDAGEGENFVFLSQLRMAVNHNMRMELAFAAERHVFADNAVRPDVAIVADRALGMDDGGGINCMRSSASSNMKVTSASLTGSPSTVQTPLALPILPRDFGQFHVDDQHVAGHDRFAPINVIRGHEIGTDCPNFPACRNIRMPATCAMASNCSTPGMIGWFGKCPGKYGSLMVTFFNAGSCCPPFSARRSTIKNG